MQRWVYRGTSLWPWRRPNACVTNCAPGLTRALKVRRLAAQSIQIHSLKMKEHISSRQVLILTFILWTRHAMHAYWFFIVCGLNTAITKQPLPARENVFEEDKKVEWPRMNYDAILPSVFVRKIKKRLFHAFICFFVVHENMMLSVRNKAKNSCAVPTLHCIIFPGVCFDIQILC